jgi:hypothetical protein
MYCMHVLTVYEYVILLTFLNDYKIFSLHNQAKNFFFKTILYKMFFANYKIGKVEVC